MAPAERSLEPGLRDAASALSPRGSPVAVLGRRIRAHWAERHYRNGYYLMLNNLTGAVAGLLFWLVLVRGYAVSQHDISTGIAFVSLSTAVALVAKGGLDLALVRHVPRTNRRDGLRLLRLAVIAAAVAVLGIVACLVGAQQALVPELDGVNAATLALLAVVAGLLAANWLQDAHFLAEGEARFSFYRNLSFHGGRLVTPALVLGLALPYPIPMAWGAALLVSVLLAVALLPRVPDARPLEQPRHNEGVPRRAFLRTAGRNVAGSSAEFLPGLLLPPLVLHLQGDLAGAYFGIAWTGASTLFLLCAAISRSTLREMGGPGDAGLWIRRAARQHLLIVAPATIGAILFAPVLLGAFGPDYASHGWPVFVPLAASVALIAPVYLYLALLRSREARGALIAYPAILLVALFGLAVPLDQAYGMMGVAWAWIAAHIPVACVAAWQLRAELRKPAATRDTPVPPHASSTAYSRVAATLTMSPTAPRR